MPAKQFTENVADSSDRREAEVLLAGALALMTDHAQACCDNHRALVAQKIASSLYTLSRHPAVSNKTRAMALSLHARWMPDPAETGHTDRPDEAASRPNPAHALRGHPIHHDDNRVLWHATPEIIQ